MTAQSILESKGYDNSECIDIISADENSLDIQVRENYGLENEPIHLWESYYIGDADEEVVALAAKKHGFESIFDLFAQMDSDLITLAEEYPAKRTGIKSAHVEIADLEDLGWEFGDLYEGVSRAKGLSLEEAEEWEKENFHALITVREDGSTYCQPYNGNESYESEETGDDEQTMKDLEKLDEEGKLWDVERF